MTATATDRLELYLTSRIDEQPGDDGCWLWTLKTDREGYGVANWAGRTHRAHRLAYTHWEGPIPDSAELDHTCEVHACVRPSHLDPVTGLVNLERKHLRRGMTPERARELALLDQEMYARQSEKRHEAAVLRAQHVAAVDRAGAAGVKVGTRLRRSRSKTAVTWKVTGVGGSGSDPWFTMVSESSGYEGMMALSDVVTAILVSSPASDGSRSRRSAKATPAVGP